MRAIFYLIQKEFRQLRRDRPMLFIMFVAPLVQTIVLGFAMTLDVNNIRVAIYDGDNSRASRELRKGFEESDWFSLRGILEEPRVGSAMLDRGTAQLVVLIPKHFARDIERGNSPTLQLAVDGLDGNTAGIALSYAQGVVQRFTGQLVPVHIERPQLSAETRYWYNPALLSKNFMVPGLIGVLLTVVTLFLTSMGLVREKELGTLEQLMVTPVRSWQLITGKVIPFLLVGVIEINIMLGVAFLVFDLQLAGSYMILVGVALLYFLTTLGLGIFISTLAGTQQQALFMAWFVMIFLILMSGFFTPIENMPDFWQGVSTINPARYFISLIRELFVKGTAPHLLLPDILPLTAIGAVIMTVSVASFRKRIA